MTAHFLTNKKTGQAFPTSGKKHSKLHGSAKSSGKINKELDDTNSTKTKVIKQKWQIYAERRKNHLDPYTGDKLKPHPEDEEYMKNFGTPARVSNKEGIRYDDRGRESILSDATKKRIKEEYPFQKFATDPYNSKKHLCGEVLCENQGESGLANAIAQFKLESVDEGGHTDGLLYNKEDDYVCASCLGNVAFHSMDWEDRNRDKPENAPYDDDDDEYDSANYDLPDFRTSPKYNAPFEEDVLNGDVTIKYNPNGFSKKDDDDYY